jgi:hypothetical protein
LYILSVYRYEYASGGHQRPPAENVSKGVRSGASHLALVTKLPRSPQSSPTLIRKFPTGRHTPDCVLDYDGCRSVSGVASFERAIRPIVTLIIGRVTKRSLMQSVASSCESANGAPPAVAPPPVSPYGYRFGLYAGANLTEMIL